MCHAGGLPRRGGAGFTIIEVLIASFVMALGALGLIALFAGVAQQHLTSLQRSRAVTMSQNATAFADVLAGLLDNGLNLSNNFAPNCWYLLGTSRETLRLSVNPNDQTRTAESLSFRAEAPEPLPRLVYRASFDGGLNTVGDPRAGDPTPPASPGDPTPSRLQEDLLSDDRALRFPVSRLLPDTMRIRVVLRGYERELLNNSNQGTGFLDPSRPTDETLIFFPAAVREVGVQALGVSEVPFSDWTPWDERAVEFTDGRGGWIVVEPDSDEEDGFARIVSLDIDAVRESTGLRVSTGNRLVPGGGTPTYVQVTSAGGTPGGEQPGFNIGQIFMENVGPGNGAFDLVPGVGDSARYENTAQGLRYVPGAGSRYVFVGEGGGGYDLGAAGGSSVPVTAAGAARWKYIHEIWIDAYEYQETEILSLGDRVQVDVSPDGDRQPVQAYSVLHRIDDLGQAEVAVVSYSLRGGAGDDPFVPNEWEGWSATGPADERFGFSIGDDSPLQNVEVGLEFDPALEQWYVTASDDLDDWVVERGQILLFAGEPSSAGMNFPGADDSVRVLRTVRNSTGDRVERRGYLDRPPRSNLRDLERVAEESFGGPRSSYRVWAVQPIVRGATQSEVTVPNPQDFFGQTLEGRDWQLEPVGVRIFPLGG